MLDVLYAHTQLTRSAMHLLALREGMLQHGAIACQIMTSASCVDTALEAASACMRSHGCAQSSSLALHEPHAPVGGHDGAADDGGELLHDCVGRGAHEEVEVQQAAGDAPLHPVLRQDHVHGVAVQQRDPVRLAACTERSSVLAGNPQCPSRWSFAGQASPLQLAQK